PESVLDTTDNAYVRDIWDFLDDKLSELNPAMKVETLYLNFMGAPNSVNGRRYGLSRRLVQLYLLCLTQQGKVRVTLSPRAGLNVAAIDYATIGEFDFSARILDNLGEIQKMARPERWELLSPFAGKLLEAALPAPQDDAAISAVRAQLRALFD